MSENERTSQVRRPPSQDKSGSGQRRTHSAPGRSSDAEYRDRRPADMRRTGTGRSRERENLREEDMRRTGTGRSRGRENLREEDMRRTGTGRSREADPRRGREAGTSGRMGQRAASYPSRSGSAVIFTALKVICLGVMIFFLYRQMSGSRESTTAFSAMQSAVTAAADMSTMQEADNQMIKRLYGLDPASYDGICLYYPLTNMGAEELFLVKLKDSSSQAEVKAAIDGRLATQKKSFEGYGIEQSAMLNRSVSEVRGNYAIFVSAADPAPMKAAFDKTY